MKVTKTNPSRSKPIKSPFSDAQLLQALKFVQGAVAKKDFVPSLTHFRIYNGMVKGFNGSLGLCSPIDCKLDVSPKGADFIRAIDACKETISLHIADNGKLVVRSGNFKTFVDCDAPENFPDITPDGQNIALNSSLLPALRYLEPFIAEDASRPWACGILFDGESAYATNNIVLLQFWLSFQFPSRICIPASAVRELIRIGDDPSRLQVSDNRLVFHYADGRWLSTQVFEHAWPDVAAVLDREVAAAQAPFPDGFWHALEQLLPFTDELGRCYLKGDKITTVATPEMAGTSVAIDCPNSGIYNGRHLINLKGIAETIAWEAYPEPVPFYGKESRGKIVGIRT